MLTGVISRTRGLANLDLVLTGRGRDGELSGAIHASGLSTTVDFTQVTYTVPDVTLEVKNSLFSAKTPRCSTARATAARSTSASIWAT